MKRYFCIALLLASCSPPPTLPIEDNSQQSSSSLQNSAVVPHQETEQLPSELSIEHFGDMKLVGTGLTLHFVEADNTDYTRHAITYLSNGLKISGILNIPKGDGPFPLLVLNHGHIPTNIYTRGRGLKREQDYLAREGFAILHTDYRGHAESDPSPDTERRVYDAGLEYSMDSVNAINAIKSSNLKQIDTTRVGMIGHSMGGGVTMNILTGRPDTIAAAMLYAPVHSDAFENYNRWRRERDEDDRTAEVMGERHENTQLWDELSSLTYLDRIAASILLFQGTNDSDVPVEWSDFLHARLQEKNKDITYVRYEGEKHEFIPQWNDYMEKTAAFFHQHLDAPAHFAEPIAQASSRVTKKPFGILIDPETSPVQPEKFSGYHSGTDFEILDGEVAHDVEIYALCSGDILTKGTVNGYGGVLIQNCTIQSQPVTVLYGHVSLVSIGKQKGDSLSSGERIGSLGTGFSEETDGERPHLHLGIHKGSHIEYKGYAASETDLSNWIDPMSVIPE